MTKRYWWVNHNATFEQEIGGSYLWSPKRESTHLTKRAETSDQAKPRWGARSQFYDNMRRASPGDSVLSFARGKISYVGTVTEFAITATKPEEFALAGARWSTEGWLLPVVWSRTLRPIAPRDFLGDIRPMLPSKYSPLVASTGRGSQKAYLAEINAALFEYVLRITESEGTSVAKPPEVDSGLGSSSIFERLDQGLEHRILGDMSLSDTEKEQLTLARRGQGKFRRNVARIEKRCRVTGVENPVLLVASHIKPWRLCETYNERLIGHNGLLLAHHVDALFDKGLISFSDEGEIMLSPYIDHSDLVKLGLDLAVRSNVGKFLPDQLPFLEFHRQKVFLDGG